MFVNQIMIVREGWSTYGYSKPKPDAPYNCTISVEGAKGKVELNLSPALTKKIMAVIADEVAAAGRETAEMLTADIISGGDKRIGN